MYDINSYQPYDVVHYLEDNKIFQFTISEFDWILKNNKNPLTTMPLPRSFLDIVRKRKDEHSCFNEAAPTTELLNKLKNIMK